MNKAQNYISLTTYSIFLGVSLYCLNTLTTTIITLLQKLLALIVCANSTLYCAEYITDYIKKIKEE